MTCAHALELLACALRARTYGCVYVCGGLVVGVCEEGDDRDHDGLDGVDGQPALLRALVPVLVLAGLVQDGYAHLTRLGH
jgi:hypothetical protein